MFLKRIYKEWRALFGVLLICMLAQLFFMAKGIENVPFFLYHMYSQAHPPKDSTAVYLVKTADGYFDHKALSNREQEILMNSISYYVSLKHDGDGTNQSIEKRFGKIFSGPAYKYLQDHLSNDSNSLSRFPQAWARYFQLVSNAKYDSVDVVKTWVYSVSPYHKTAADSIIFSIKLK